MSYTIYKTRNLHKDNKQAPWVLHVWGIREPPEQEVKVISTEPAQKLEWEIGLRMINRIKKNQNGTLEALILYFILTSNLGARYFYYLHPTSPQEDNA